jgi:quinoprotein glucose dehydrogenase
VIGGANWGGGAFDPESGILYVKSSNAPAIARLRKVDTPVPGELEATYVMNSGNATFHNGLPLLKPPAGHLTAIDLNKGEIAWRVPFPAAGAAGSILTKSGLIFVGGGDTALHAVDSTNGQDLWTHPLGRRTTATPMTYRSAGGKQFVVIASGNGRDATLTAFTLE